MPVLSEQAIVLAMLVMRPRSVRDSQAGMKPELTSSQNPIRPKPGYTAHRQLPTKAEDTEHGLFNGIMTLRQLFQKSNGTWQLPLATRLNHRGA